VWDVQTGNPLLSIRDERVFRARDDQEIGRVVDGNIYDFGGRFLCHLVHLGAPGSAGAAIPEALRLLLE
jgi:hypothetical protein